MRASVRLLLAEDAVPPSPAELATLTATVRGHMELLAPEVEGAAARLPEDDIPRCCALACVGEARAKLRTTPDPEADDDALYPRSLARSLNALCDHWENLNRAGLGAGQ